MDADGTGEADNQDSGHGGSYSPETDKRWRATEEHMEGDCLPNPKEQDDEIKDIAHERDAALPSCGTVHVAPPRHRRSHRQWTSCQRMYWSTIIRKRCGVSYPEAADAANKLRGGPPKPATRNMTWLPGV